MKLKQKWKTFELESNVGLLWHIPTAKQV